MANLVFYSNFIACQIDKIPCISMPFLLNDKFRSVKQANVYQMIKIYSKTQKPDIYQFFNMF